MTRRPKHKRPKCVQVRTVVAGLTLCGPISLEQMAAHLRISTRTLQRRLHDGGVSFRTIVAQSRCEAASALLRETDMSMAQIAASIGYSTPSAFSRAFAQWSGCTPRAYRTPAKLSDNLARNGQK